MATTLAEIIYQARLETNTVGSTFFDDAVELPIYVNDAVKEVYDRVVAAYAPYFAKKAYFTLDGSNEIALADLTDPGGDPPVSDFYKELGVDWLPTGDPTRTVTVLPLGTFLARNEGSCGIGEGLYGPARRYLLSGTTLSILPASGQYQGDYVLQYIPNCPELSDVDDLPAELTRWSKLIVLYTALTMRTKRQVDTSETERKIQFQERRIDDLAQHRVKEGKRMPTRTVGSRGGFFGNQGL